VEIFPTYSFQLTPYNQNKIRKYLHSTFSFLANMQLDMIFEPAMSKLLKFFHGFGWSLQILLVWQCHKNFWHKTFFFVYGFVNRKFSCGYATHFFV
jgi:hypothetical protein